jgi:hypothetical protein
MLTMGAKGEPLSVVSVSQFNSFHVIANEFAPVQDVAMSG